MLPKAIATVVNDYLEEMDASLPGALQALYITGSVALGAFDERFSDIDFIAVVRHLPEGRVKDVLTQVHRRIHTRHRRHGMDGMVVTDKMLQGTEDALCLVFSSGRLVGTGRFAPNSLDAFHLQKYGITIRGPQPDVYPFPIDWNELSAKMVENLNTYWKRWSDGCAKFPSVKHAALLFSPKMVEWGVLGVSRIYYSLREHDIASKTAAGQYMLGIAPQRWHRILREALRVRSGGKAQYTSVFSRKQDVLDYIDYIIVLANTEYPTTQSSTVPAK